ncbi:MAG: hypothetical protein AAGA67_08475, partial [Cyanobacteria bacterium P01_F01_bin.153]
MAVIQTQQGERELTRLWFQSEVWYSVLLSTNPNEGALPANPDHHAAFYAEQQVLPGNGYPGALGPYSFSEPVWNAGQSRYDQSIADQSFTASGGDVSFQAYALVRGHKGLPPQPTTLSSNTFTTTAHGLSSGDLVVIVSDGGSLPSGYTSGLTYRVDNATANTFTIENFDGSSVSLSGGSSLYVTPVNGAWAVYEDFDAVQTVADGQTQNIGL